MRETPIPLYFPACRVCRHPQTSPIHTKDGCNYWRCPNCLATFLDAAQLLGPEEEFKRYSLHMNDPADQGYRTFLRQLADPLLQRLPTNQVGLDYGCGSGPALAQMLTQAGHTVKLYDPFFHPDTAGLTQTYDFITCTEVAEHFYHPYEEFGKLRALLRPGGLLAIMTCFQTDDSRFENWQYRRDETHVTFYKEETFHHLAALFGWQCDVPCRNVVFMRKAE